MKVSTMTIAQEGAYHRLLCYAWLSEDCSLPADLSRLQTLAKWTEPAEHFQPVLHQFKAHPRDPKKLINPRLFKERQKVDALRKLKTKAAAVRWRKDSHQPTPSKEKQPSADWLTTIKTNPAYQQINVEHELAKMDAWLTLPANQHRKKTKRFVLNWLNRIEKPLGNGQEKPSDVCQQCKPPQKIAPEKMKEHLFAYHSKLVY
jgi:hypothetical protein